MTGRRTTAGKAPRKAPAPPATKAPKKAPKKVPKKGTKTVAINRKTGKPVKHRRKKSGSKYIFVVVLVVVLR